MLQFILTWLLIQSIIIIHELGHLVVALYFNKKIDTISLGFGPVLYQNIFKYKNYSIPWSISLIFLGGYVELNEKEKLNLTSKENFFISFGGPAANFILSWICLYVVTTLLAIDTFLFTSGNFLEIEFITSFIMCFLKSFVISLLTPIQVFPMFIGIIYLSLATIKFDKIWEIITENSNVKFVESVSDQLTKAQLYDKRIISNYSGDYWFYLVSVIGGISFLLGISNLIPFPGLDGSSMLYAFIEMIIGKERINKIYNAYYIKYLQAACILLILVPFGIIIPFFNDILYIGEIILSFF